ncbi:hypothetical protein BJV74DRAFT_951985 [Russula compacta]|nr:hypothetical protein BJV74DRAFT_951985 [Russula compacta]
MEISDIRAHYNAYLAGGNISIYNPMLVMSALVKNKINNYWIATGQFPLLQEFPFNDLAAAGELMRGAEIRFTIQDDVMYSSDGLTREQILTLWYYTGYLTMTSNGQFKIPNREVMMGWARWITRGAPSLRNKILTSSVSTPSQSRPNEVNARLRRDFILFTCFASCIPSLTTTGMSNLKLKPVRAYIDIRLTKGDKAVLIELRFSSKVEDLEADADRALKQIVDTSYRNRHGLEDSRTLREYGIACFHLDSFVKGRYLELSEAQTRWVEKR